MALRLRTVRARLTLWYTLVLAVPLIAFALFSYATFARTLRSRTDAFIRDGLNVFARELRVERSRATTLANAAIVTAHEVRFRDLDIAILHNGNLIALSTWTEQGGPQGQQRLSATTLSTLLRVLADADGRPSVASLDGRSFRVIAEPLLIDGQSYTLAGTYSLVEVQNTLQRIRRMLLIAIPLLIASAATGGYFLAKRSFAPVTAMAARAAEIGASNLHERLPVAADDELGALARVLNQLLDRVEASFAQQRRFMADASHELRTPASIVRTEADVTLGREHRSESEYRESMIIVQDAARRLTRIVDDIFLLARSDAGHLVMQPSDIALEDVVHDTARAVRPIADRRAVRISLGELVEAPFKGDADLLGRVILNLLDNSIKYAPRGGRVEIGMNRRDGWYDISVIDDGPGIPAEFHGRVFDRFFRVDPARSRAETTITSGSGLGLAIARRIAEMHGGRLDLVTSTPGRTHFRLSLPAGPKMT